MMKYNVQYLLAVLFVPSCTSFFDRPIVYTGTQYAVHASGLKSEVPEKLKVGYERNELAWLPDGQSSSVAGSFDTEYRNFNGVAISESLITGQAASGEGPPAEEESPSPKVPSGSTENYGNGMLLSTTTKLNLGIEAASTDGVGPSFNLGFKRSVLALFPKKKEQADELPSTYTDVSLHIAGLAGKINSPNGITGSRHLDGSANGSRIVQVFATGKAAEHLGKISTTESPQAASGSGGAIQKNTQHFSQ